MRKTLSLVLALAMLLSLLPQGLVSAEATAEGREHTYVFGANTIEPGYSGSYINLASSLDLWNPDSSGAGQLGKYYEAAGGTSVPYSASNKWAFVGRRTTANYRVYPEYTYISHYAANSTDEKILANNPGFIIKIKVEEDGLYQPTLEHWKMNAAAKYELFVVDTDYGSTDSTFALSTLTDVSSGNNEAKISAAIAKCKDGSAGESLGVIEPYQATSTNKDAKHNFKQIPLNEGEYYLVFAHRGYATGTDTTTSPTFYIEKLTLTPVQQDKLTGVKLAAGKNEGEIGDRIALSATGIYSVSGEKLLTSGVTFTSSNTDVATVTEAGVVHCLSAGTVKITAAVDGTEFSAETEITVLSEDLGNAGVELNFVTNTNSMLDQTVYGSPRLDASGVLRDFGDIDEFKEINPEMSAAWHFAGYSGYSINMSRQFIHSQVLASKYGTESQPYLALKINVINKGDYNLWVEPYTVTDGTRAKVYIVSAKNAVPSRELISRAQLVGEVEFAGDEGDKAPERKIGVAHIDSRGEYYVIFDYNSDNQTLLSDVYHRLILQGIRLIALPGEFEKLSLSVNGMENGGIMPLNTEKQLKWEMCDIANVPLENVPESEVKKVFASSDESVATVSENGRISAVGNGDAIITATVEYDNKKVEETFSFTVATTGENLMEGFNYDFSEDTWEWSLPNEPEEPETPKFMRTMIATEADGNRALKFVFDRRVAAVSNPPTMMLKNGIRVKGVSGGLYLLKFKFKANYTVPDGATDIPVYLDLLAFTNEKNNTSEFLAYNSERSMDITKIANWRELYNDWYEVTVPIAAPTVASTETVYLTPRIIFRPSSTDLSKSGYDGEAWFDDFEIREVGFAGVDFAVEGNTTSGTAATLTLIAKPYASTGDYISLGGDWTSEDVTLSSTDEYVIGNFGVPALVSGGAGSGYNYVNATASTGGKNGEAEVSAIVTINGVTRTGSAPVTSSGFEQKLLYAQAHCADDSVEVYGSSRVLSQGFMSDGSEADMAGVSASYKSLTPDIVSVDADGSISALRAGKGKILVTLTLSGNSVQTETEITVTDSSKIVSAKLEGPETVGYRRDEKLALSGVMESKAAADISAAEVEWTVISAPTDGITVSEDGYVFGNTYGATAKIKAYVSLGGAMVETNEIEITVTETDMRDFFIDFRKASKTVPTQVLINEDGWRLNLEKSASNVSKSTLNLKGLNGMTRYLGDDLAIDVNVPYDGIYRIVFTGTLDANCSLESDIYVDGVYVGSYTFWKDVDEVADAAPLRTIELSKGEHTFIFRSTKAGPKNNYQYLKELRFANRTSLPEMTALKVITDSINLAVGKSTQLGAVITMSDGFEFMPHLTLSGENDPYVPIEYSVDTDGIITVSPAGEITALAEGEAVVTIVATPNGKSFEKTVTVYVTTDGIADKTLTSAEITAPYFVMGPESAGVQLSAVAKNVVGDTLEGASVTWEIDDSGVAEISAGGYVTPKDAGSATVTATVTLGDVTVTATAPISVREGKTTRTYYIDEMVEAAQENVTKYRWAKELKNTAVEKADKYLAVSDILWDSVPGEGLPRSYAVGYKNDPYTYYCRYCGKNLYSTYGNYPFVANALSRPWKVQCPDCKRLFPSNDFASFYELGRTKENGGIFDLDTALREHEKLFGGTYGTGYLKNTLYPEIGTEKGNVTLSAGEASETWGVDDGFGYKTGVTFSNGVPEVHTYVAYYNHMGLWFESGSSEEPLIKTALTSFADAYLYTGDEKYGRAGAILLDRIADVYPAYDLRPYLPQFSNNNGGSVRGKIIGSIWETYLTQDFAKAYDAFFPMYDDPQVISYLSAKAAQYNMENDKSTPEKIRSNIENGICRGIYDACRQSLSLGNFGLHQSGLTMAAVVLDTQPDTNEMLDWVFQYGETDNTSYNTGGDVNAHLVADLSRDGQGNESSPQYNYLWITELSKAASALGRYDGYDGMDFYSNPKYIGMIKSYAPLTLVRRGLGQIGDTGFAVHFSPMPTDDSIMIDAFAFTGDIEIAQHFYFLKEGNLSDVHYDVFTKDPERLEDEIEEIIETYGEYNYDKSSMLADYGFAALRAGTLYNSVGNNVIRDTTRDFWVYFGGAKSHSHEDMLNLGVEAYGIGMTTDLGYPEVTSSTDPHRRQWLQNTLSHNAVMVNEQTQNRSLDPQKPLHFDAKDTRVKVLDVDAPGAYTATDEYRRTVVMVDYDGEVSYGIDFFRVLGGDDHLYVFHPNSQENPETSSNLKFETQPGGSYAGVDVPFGADPYTNTSSAYTRLKYPMGYTWLFDVHRAENTGAKEFYIDYKINDFRNHSRNGKMNIRLRMTMVNDFAADEVTLANGMPPRTAKNLEVMTHLEYMLVRRKGRDLNTLFTTVIEPYNGERYIKEDGISRVDIVPKDAASFGTDQAAAVKIELDDGRIDYIVYTQDNGVTYTITDSDTGYTFDFKGFVGVWTVKENADGTGFDNVYSYVNDGELIGDEVTREEWLAPEFTGTIVDFQDELSFDNWIEVEFDRELTQEEADELCDRMINIERTENGNSAFMIEGVTMTNATHGIIDIGEITTISGYIDEKNEALGYTYDVAVGKTFGIPMSYEVNPAPVFEEVSNITTSAGSSVSVSVRATSEDGAVTYSARTLPRGASFNPQTRTFTWKPDSSQIGENLVAIDAVDECGRISTQYFTVTVYGSTTGKPSNTTETPSTDNSGTSSEGTSSGGGGGGGGGAAPDNGDSSDQNDVGDSGSDVPQDNVDGEKSPEASGETDDIRFTDLSNHEWAADAINTLADDGIIRGTTSDTYSPANNITRADFASLLVRAFKLESDNAENFADVSANDYFAAELAIARNSGIVNGIGDNRYAPRNHITRQDMMVIVYRVLNSLPLEVAERERSVGTEMNDSPGDYQNRDVTESQRDKVSAELTDEVLSQYPDYDTVAEYAKDAVSALISAGIVNGKNGLIAPMDYTTRAEVAVLIKRVADYVK